jgi:hypothetical protein
MTAQLIRKSKSARKKAAYNTVLQIIIDKKIAGIARSEREDSDRIARVDAAHRSDRGYRGGNLGHN